MDVSEKAVKSLAARLASEIGDCLASNTEFLQRIANALSLPETKEDARSIADTTSSGYEASADTDDSNACNLPPFGGYQRIEEKTTKKVVTYYGCEKVACPTCNKAVTRAYLRDHMNIHLMYHKRPHCCEICEARFTSKTGLNQHVRQLHPNCSTD